MANVINTRIQLKYDTLEQWVAENPLLLAGELAIVTIGNSHTSTTPDNGTHPVLFKVGPGNFNALPFASALAADVYAWAKESTLFSDTTATTVTSGDKTYVGNAITAAAWDSTLNGGKGGIKFTKGTQFATKAELDAALDAFGGDLDAITDTDTKYAFELVTTDGDAHKGQIKVTATTYTNGVKDASTDTYFDVLTTEEVNAILANYYTQEQVDNLIQGAKDYADNANTTYTLGVGDNTSQGTIKITPNEGNTSSITVNGLDSIKVSSGNGTVNISIKANTTDFGRSASDSSELALSASVHTSLDLANSAVQPEDLGDLATKDNITHAEVTDFDTAVAAIKVANATHADSADNATNATTADKVAHTLTVGNQTFNGSTDVAITAADLGLESAMHFVGAMTEAPATAKNGDVYLNTATKKEYVYSDNGWVELGDEGSYALRSVTITGTDGLTGGGDLTKNQTITHAVPTGATAGSVGGTDSDMKFVAAITTDKFGHVTNKTEKTLDLSRFVLKDFEIKAGDGLTGGGVMNGTDVTISHDDTSSVSNVTKTARTYVAGMTFDDFGHVTAVETATETDQDLSNYKTKQGTVTKVPEDTTRPFLVTKVEQNENGEIDVEFGLLSHNLTAYKYSDYATIALQIGGAGNQPDEVALKGDDYISIAQKDADTIEFKATKKLSDAVALAETAIQPTDLHEIATTGSIYDVEEGSNTSTDGVEYLIFNCGSASTII